jgi:hypothetical protein
MSKRFLFTAFCFSILSFSLADFSHAGRGGGGGSRGGGGAGGARGGGGGGFSGGVSRGGSGGGAVGGARPSPSMGSVGGTRPGGGAGIGNASPGARPGAGTAMSGPVGAGGGARPGAGAGTGGTAGIGGGARPAAGAGMSGATRLGGGPSTGASTAAANRYNSPSRNDLSGFLGLPSDEGLGHATASAARTGTMSSASTMPAREGNVDVNYGKTEGPRGGQVGGVTATGPQGNTVGKAAAVGPQGGTAVVGGVQGEAGGTAIRGAAVGPQGGAAVVGGVQGAAGGTAVRGAAVGPNGQVVAGRGAVGPGGYGGGGIVTAGPAGVGAGFTRVSPSGRYTAAAAVRGNYTNWGVYGTAWRVQYPGAWVATRWTTYALWSTATWGTAASYCGYAEQPPVYYDYGTSVVYEDNSVYINGDAAGTTEEYYDQAASIAATGAEAKAQPDGEWLPLGVFAFTKAESPNSDITIQLAVNKDGVVRGNYTDTATKQNQVVQGSIDKQTQRVAFTVGENKTNIIETGLYNLTKEEAPCLLHIGKESTEQWMLVRLKNPEATAG